MIHFIGKAYYKIIIFKINDSRKKLIIFLLDIFSFVTFIVGLP